MFELFIVIINLKLLILCFTLVQIEGSIFLKRLTYYFDIVEKKISMAHTECCIKIVSKTGPLDLNSSLCIDLELPLACKF